MRTKTAISAVTEVLLMPRPPRDRIVEEVLSELQFRPVGTPVKNAEEIVLSFDEAEALRLADFEGLYQQAAAIRMGVSRTTFGRIVSSARHKTSDAILHAKKLRIEGGAVIIGGFDTRPLKIAVPQDPDGRVEEHFGRSQSISIFSIAKDQSLLESLSLEAQVGPGCKSGVFAILSEMGVSVLLVGCIGEGALRIASAHGLQVLRGASGDIRSSIRDYLSGKLKDSGRECGRACMGRSRDCR